MSQSSQPLIDLSSPETSSATDYRPSSIHAQDLAELDMASEIEHGIESLDPYSAHLEHGEDEDSHNEERDDERRYDSSPHSHDEHEVQTYDGPAEASETSANMAEPSQPETQPDQGFLLPRWQPDAEVTYCPICQTQFSFFNRKHHCRYSG
jgi:hypothetical protein